MATMNIKDPRVHELARELAELRRTSATAAVRQALEDALREENRRRADRVGALRALQLRAAAIPEWLEEQDLYDETGLPR
ncbi:MULTISPECIES: type II toxin-antitoxin system VapB family antitoxin [unclassified Luteococcus]|uniref:type II toxin-antitoxin system VapB family antitoxin n=1 Tax=unclassified Luteococcus TaxID=2639923 RepID=UPI00313D2DC4